MPGVSTVPVMPVIQEISSRTAASSENYRQPTDRNFARTFEKSLRPTVLKPDLIL